MPDAAQWKLQPLIPSQPHGPNNPLVFVRITEKDRKAMGMGYPFPWPVYWPGPDVVNYVTEHVFKHYHGRLGEECTIAFQAFVMTQLW